MSILNQIKKNNNIDIQKENVNNKDKSLKESNFYQLKMIII